MMRSSLTNIKLSGTAARVSLNSLFNNCKSTVEVVNFTVFVLVKREEVGKIFLKQSKITSSARTRNCDIVFPFFIFKSFR